MLPIQIIIAIQTVHWVADFIVQGHKDAEDKWKDKKKLTNHVFTYTITLTFGMWLACGIIKVIPLGHEVATPISVLVIFVLVWALLNGVLHWVTDYITSKQVHRLKEEAPFKQTKYKDMMILIGLDQLIHTTTLLISWHLIPVEYLVKGYFPH